MIPVWVTFFLAAIAWLPLGVVIGLAAGRTLGKIACERAWQEGHLSGVAAGRKAECDSLWCQMESDLRRRHPEGVLDNATGTTFATKEPAP